MECQNKGLWHLGISDEACQNAGGTWYRTPCVTLQKMISERPSRFDLENPLEGTCQHNLGRLETAYVSASTSHRDFPFEATRDGCHDFCRSLPGYSTQIGMMTTPNGCTCVYRNDKLPSRELMPSYAKPSPSKFTLTNSDGMALGLRPNIDCNATAEDLTIETQISDPNNPRQQFEITHDGQVVSVRCPKKVLTATSTATSAVTKVKYIRVSLSGSNKVIHLSEVQVFAMVNGVETNVALASSGATATQSSTYPNSIPFSASNAINGQHSGTIWDITHTNFENNPWWEVKLTDSYDVTRIVIWNRLDCCLEKLSGAVSSLLDANRNVVEEYALGDTTGKRKFEFDLHPTSSFHNIQFPVGYDFPQDPSGVVDRTFQQEAFHGGAGTALTDRKFSLIDPETNLALFVTDCDGFVRTDASNELLTSQQFRITHSDQIESINCPGKVLSFDIVKSTWMCKRGSDEKGAVTIFGTNNADAVSACKESKNSCSNDNPCTVTRTHNDYCMDGNRLILKASNPADASQKWRFYDDGIVNLACGRTNGNFAMTQISDDNFQDIALFEELQFSFVNPSSGEAIGIGVEVSEGLFCVFAIMRLTNKSSHNNTLLFIGSSTVLCEQRRVKGGHFIMLFPHQF